MILSEAALYHNKTGRVHVRAHRCYLPAKCLWVFENASLHLEMSHYLFRYITGELLNGVNYLGCGALSVKHRRQGPSTASNQVTVR